MGMLRTSQRGNYTDAFVPMAMLLQTYFETAYRIHDERVRYPIKCGGKRIWGKSGDALHRDGLNTKVEIGWMIARRTRRWRMTD